MKIKFSAARFYIRIVFTNGHSTNICLLGSVEATDQAEAWRRGHPGVARVTVHHITNFRPGAPQ